MDKNAKEQKKKTRNFIHLLMLLGILILFVISAFINEILGMLMFGVLIFYVIMGNHSYKVEHKAYEEILQSKRELLNYDRSCVEQKKKEDANAHMKKSHLIMIALMFVVMCLCSHVSIELGMIIFGAIIFFILYVSD